MSPNSILSIEDLSPELKTLALETRCAADFPFWLENYGVVEIRGIGVRPFSENIWPYQTGLAQLFQQESRLVILKARQTGVSTMAMHFAYWLCRFGEPHSQHVLVLSKSKEDAAYLLEKVPVINAAQPESLRTDATVDRTFQYTLSNGNTIECLASTPSGGRSRAATAIVLDEHAFHQAAEQNWTALAPTLEGAGHFIVISTGNGQGNLFYNLYAQAKAQESEFRACFIPFDAPPHRNEEWRETEREGYPMGEELFNQEYPRSDREAFTKTGTCRFDVEWVEDQINKPHDSPTLMFDGRGRLFEKVIPGQRYIAGLDCAQGLNEQGNPDATSLKIITPQFRHVASYEVKAGVEPGVVAQEIMQLLRVYNPFLCVERNKGAGMIAALQALGYSNFYRFEKRHIQKDAKEERNPQIGIQMTTLHKKLMVEQLTAVVNSRALHSEDVSMWQEFPTYVQLSATQWGATGTAKDDQVTGMGWAIWAAGHMPPPRRKSRKKRVLWV